MRFLAALIGTMAWTQASAGDGTKSAASDAAQDTRQAGQEAKQETQQAAGQAKEQGQQAGREAAAETQQTARAATQGDQAKKSVVGEVKSIDEQKLTLENRLGETHDFALGSDTKFMRDGKAVSRDDIQEGAQVRASFTGSANEDDLQATRIDVMESGAAGGAGATGGSSGSSSSGDAMGGSGGSSGSSSDSSTGSSGGTMGSGGSSGSSGSSTGGRSPSGSDRQ